MDKYLPQVGEHLYLRQYTTDCWINDVRHPYTVISVKPNEVLVQECKLIFNGPRYYDTIADDIQEDPNGRIVTLIWGPKNGRWQEKGMANCYPLCAVFGKWEHAPYLNQEDKMEKLICCICGKEITEGWGNNPSPIKSEGK